MKYVFVLFLIWDMSKKVKQSGCREILPILLFDVSSNCKQINKGAC